MVRELIESIGLIVGCIWGVFYAIMIFFVGIGAVALILLGIPTLFIIPPVGMGMIAAGAVCIGGIGRGK